MAQNEKQFELKVRKYLEDKGAWVFKVAGGGFQRSGVPDLIVCLNGKFLAVEVKAENGTPSDLQIYNVAKINEAGGKAVILYPYQFDDFKRMIENEFLR